MLLEREADHDREMIDLKRLLNQEKKANKELTEKLHLALAMHTNSVISDNKKLAINPMVGNVATTSVVDSEASIMTMMMMSMQSEQRGQGLSHEDLA